MTPSVLDGRTLRFSLRDRDEHCRTYEVLAVGKGAPVSLGWVERWRESTDSQIAGTRLRRPGKGRWVFSARAFPDQVTALGYRHYEHYVVIGGSFSRGEMWLTGRRGVGQTRASAAADLVAWHDDPKARRTRAEMDG